MKNPFIAIGESIHASIPKTGGIMKQLSKLGANAYSTPGEPRTAMVQGEQGPQTRLTAKNAESAEKKIKLKNSALSASSAVKDSPPTGCAFGPRCPLATGDCLKQTPMLTPLEPFSFGSLTGLKERSDYEGHFAACWKC